MPTVKYSDFNDKEVVSSLRRTLYLDNSQFENLPSGTIKLSDVKVSKIEPNNPDTVDNVKYYKFSAIDTAQIEAIKKAGATLPKNILEQMLANIPKVYFRVVIDGGKAENAQKLFNFITSNNLDNNVTNISLSNLDWHVTWVYDDQYHDVLTLVVDNFDKVKITAGK